jgi:ABC-type uncharacterized transport system involved in gliding motility auxiliary subunit
MNENRISLDISQVDMDAINLAIQTLADKLQPLLIALEAADRQSLAKMKDKSVPFLEKIVQYVQSNPEFVPIFLNTEEMKKDFKAFTILNNFLRPLAQITRNLEDTSMLCGSEAYLAGLVYYSSVKQAAKVNVPKAQAIADDLSTRFEAQKLKKSKAEPIK